jgi:hypothetical protein
VLDNLLCHNLLCDRTYISLVGVENTLHNVLVVRICGTLLVICLILHLYIHLDLCVVHCTEVPSYTTWDYSVVMHYYNVVSHFFIDVENYCMVVASG